MSEVKKSQTPIDGDAGRLPRTRAALEAGVAEGLHLGAQAYVSHGGKVVGDFAVGTARAGVPMRRDSLVLWLSATKPVAAVAVAQLWEKGLLDLDDPVARHIPEFAARGKEAVTIRHVLTHTGGFRGILGNWEDRPWERIIAAVCDAKLEAGWEPGKKAGYHLATSWYVLGELVRRLDPGRRPFERYVREEIFLALGMNDSWVGMPPEKYRQYGERIAWTYDTRDPGHPKSGHPFDTEAGAAACRPGSNGRGPVRELGFFYEMLIRKGARAGGVRIASPQAVEAITAPHRIGMYDQTFKHVMDWGLGFILNSARYGADTVPYGYGPHASPRTFGHGGSQCSTGFADPENGLVVALMCNGRPGEAAHDRRLRSVLAAVYEDLDLAGDGAAV
jgi:CubicO group peptidase (beta-lactamase class C family)